MQVVLTTEGCPLDANVELWQSKITPCKMRVYVENGQMSVIFAAPRGPNHTVAVRNVGRGDWPMSANVYVDYVNSPSDSNSSTTIPGGTLRQYRVDPNVESVEVTLKTEGRPLNARIELSQRPDKVNQQVIELYTQDGLQWPLLCLIETPGVDNSLRIINTAAVEFNMTATVVPRQQQWGGYERDEYERSYEDSYDRAYGNRGYGRGGYDARGYDRSAGGRDSFRGGPVGAPPEWRRNEPYDEAAPELFYGKSLMELVSDVEYELGMRTGRPLDDVLLEACDVLGVAPGGSLMERAVRCWTFIHSADGRLPINV